MLLWEGVWLLSGMALTLAMEWAVAPSTSVKDGYSTMTLTLAGSDGLLSRSRSDTKHCFPSNKWQIYTKGLLAWTVTDTVAYALIIGILKHTTWYIDVSLATILLLYLADRDALASAKRHTCSAWRKEPAIGEWKGNPVAPFNPSNWLAMGHTSKANSPEISV